MQAVKCDRCGKMHEIYGVRNDAQNGNSIMVLNTDAKRQYFSHSVIDLCPECMAALYKFLKMDGGSD